jgi:mannose-6-phosphate isomerase-like protein (cupin superfamily)
MPDIPFDLTRTPLHLGLGATAVVEPTFDGLAWYADYAARHAADGRGGRLVTIHQFSEPWRSWEMHPVGAEVVVCLEGRLTLVQEIDGTERRVVLTPYQGAINPPGVWHTADVAEATTAIFITAGEGTQHRER